MVKKNQKKTANKETKINKIVNQVKEPLSLLETLKEEGMSRALFLMGAASGAAKQINKDKILAQFKEAVSAAGFVTRADLEKLEERIEVLEAQLSEIAGDCCDGGCDGEAHVHDEDEE